ncbi:hypothetical protein CsSME_00026665 [Camellia sinensis var. sinensis]
MEPISTSLNLECQGRVYSIRVFEEQIPKEVNTSCKGANSNEADKDVCSNINGVLHLPAETNFEKAVEMAAVSDVAKGDLASCMKVRAELAESGSWSHALAVEETKDCAGNSNEEGTCVVKSSLLAESLQ